MVQRRTLRFFMYLSVYSQMYSFSCWAKASPQKQESLKDHPSYTNYFCQAFQCWEFPNEGGSCCENHVHARSRSPRRTRSVETLETPQSDAVQSSILPSIETIETAQLRAIIQECVDELAWRASRTS